MEVVPQVGGGLDRRLAAAFQLASGPTLLVGMDTPQITPSLLRAGLDLLGARSDAVLGPATDGGYYFLGMNRLYKSLFFNKPWSTGQLLKATLQEAKKLGLNPLMLETLSDIDVEKDLKNLKEVFKTRNP